MAITKEATVRTPRQPQRVEGEAARRRIAEFAAECQTTPDIVKLALGYNLKVGEFRWLAAIRQTLIYQPGGEGYVTALARHGGSPTEGADAVKWKVLLNLYLRTGRNADLVERIIEDAILSLREKRVRASTDGRPHYGSLTHEVALIFESLRQDAEDWGLYDDDYAAAD